MGTEAPPERNILDYASRNYIKGKQMTQAQLKERRQLREQEKIKKYSEAIAKEIESNEELNVMNNIIHRSTKETKKTKYRSKLLIVPPPETTEGNKGLQFDFDKIRSLYNISLLENNMMTKEQLYK